MANLGITERAQSGAVSGDEHLAFRLGLIKAEEEVINRLVREAEKDMPNVLAGMPKHQCHSEAEAHKLAV